MKALIALMLITQVAFAQLGVQQPGFPNGLGGWGLSKAVTTTAVYDPVTALGGKDSVVGLYTVSDLSTIHTVSGTKLDGDVVTGWDDKSRNGNHFVQADAAKAPLLRINAGGNYLEFDGSNDVMVAPYTASQQATVVLNAKMAAATAWRYAWSIGSYYSFMAYNNGWAQYADEGNNIVSFGGSVLAWTITEEVVHSLTVANAYRNDTLVTVFDPNDYSFFGAPPTSFYIGGTTNSFSRVQIRDIVVTKTAVSDAKRTELYSYLKTVR